MLKPVGSLCPPVVNRYLIGWWLVVIGAAFAALLLRVVSVVKTASVSFLHNKVIPEKGSLLRHLHHGSIVCHSAPFTCLRHRDDTLTSFVHPQAHKDSGSSLIPLKRQREHYITAGLSRSKGLTIYGQMGIVAYF